MRTLIFTGCVVLALGSCATTQDTMSDERDRQLVELRQRQAKLESKIEDLDTRMALLVEKVDRAVPKPPPELEVVQIEPEPTANDYAEIDEYDPVPEEQPVVLKLYGEKAAKEKTGKTGLRPTAKPKVKDLYQGARQLFQERRFAMAAQAFEHISTNYPKHSLADNALYWRGVCHYELGEHTRAIDQLQQVPTVYPQSPKVPDALLKIGQAYLALKDKISAKAFLTQLVEQYPRAEATKTAQKLLQETS